MVRIQQMAAACILATGASISQAQTPLCAGMPNGPTITDPNAASCVYDAAANAAVITLNREAVLDWQRVDQRPGSSLTFTFDPRAANPTVLNRLGTLNPRLGAHRFAGTLQSNGRVVILSPQTNVNLSGNIDVGELVAVVSEVTPAGEAALMQGNQMVDFVTSDVIGATARPRLLTVKDAQISSSQGDVVLGAASLVGITSSSVQQTSIQSAGSTRIFSGNRVRYNPSASDLEKITPLPNNESNAVLQSGTINAGGNVEISAADAGQILISGPITADDGNGRIFLRVNNGSIDISPQANLSGILESTGAFESVLFEGNEGDTPATSSPSVGHFPSLRKGSATNRNEKRSKSVKVYQGAPVVASSEASRQQGGGSRSNQANRAVAKKKKSQRALVQRSGFFGLRGAKVSKRD